MSDPTADMPATSDAAKIGDAWGDDISDERKRELDAILAAWDVETDHGPRSGPFDVEEMSEEEVGDSTKWRLSGADVFYLAAKLLVGTVLSGDNEPIASLSTASAMLRSSHSIGRLNHSALLLHGADLRSARLSNANLEFAQFDGANLTGAQLASSYLNAAHFHNADLSAMDATNASLAGAHLDFARFQRADLTGATLHEASAKHGNFYGAQLTAANLSYAHLESANLHTAQLNHADLHGAHLQSALLRGASLVEANLTDAHLAGNDLTEGQLTGANLSNATLSDVKLRAANLEQANFHGAKLDDVDLSEANLTRAEFGSAYLTQSVLTSTRLTGADLRMAHLSGIDLRHANLVGTDLRFATFEGAVQFHGCKLTNVSLDQITPGAVNFTVVSWEGVSPLGDELRARATKDEGGGRKDRSRRIDEYEAGVRANRLLATALRAQGLAEDSDVFAYRAQLMQRGLRFQRRQFGRWLTSWGLAALSGYGYRLGRIFLSYAIVVLTFAALFLLPTFLSGVIPTIQQGADALQISLNAIHGRVFFVQFGLDTLQSWLATAESVIGIVIEGVFVAMIIQRLFR